MIAVDDPGAAAATLESAIGLTATAGGRHEAGTHNRLVFLGDAYLELIGVWDRDRAFANPIGAAAAQALEARAPGLVTYALATDGARREVGALHAAGSPISDAVAGSRTRPDGEVVAWHCAYPPVLGPAFPPFLIEHELEGVEWDERARRGRAAFVHPFGGRARLVGLELVVSDPEAVAASYARTVGVTVPPGAGSVPGERETRVGDHGIRLVPPAAATMGTGAAGEGSGAATVSAGAGAAGAARREPAARIAISGTAGERVLRDLLGVRFIRL